MKNREKCGNTFLVSCFVSMVTTKRIHSLADDDDDIDDNNDDDNDDKYGDDNDDDNDDENNDDNDDDNDDVYDDDDDTRHIHCWVFWEKGAKAGKAGFII